MIRRVILSALLAVSIAATASGEETKASETIVLKAARLIDGTGAAPLRDVVVIVRGEAISDVGTAASTAIPTGAKVIDLGDATLLPGFIDAHTHVVGRTVDDPKVFESGTRDFEQFGAILAVPHVKDTLLAGFTSIRNVGASHFDDLAIRKAIEEGWVPGPRIEAAGHALGITGGHCDENGFRPGLFDGGVREGIVNSPDEGRAAVRYQVKYGADVIKICATGGVLSEGDAVGATQFTLEEMEAIVAEAHKLGRKVAAHAHGTEGIKLAVRAGVDSIEHGSFLDEEGAKMMARQGTYLVPTLMAGEAVAAFAESGHLKGDRAVKATTAAKAIRNAIRIAVANRVPIALGTDAGVIPHGKNAREFFLMVDWGGMSPMAALVSGTSSAARLLGWSDRLGTVAKGKLADIVAVPGNPLEDIRRTEDVMFVMKGGTIYKNPPSGNP